MEHIGKVIRTLLESGVAAVEYGARLHLQNDDPASPSMRSLQARIAEEEPAAALLGERDTTGAIARHPYEKWRGAHWVLSVLAELHYPPGDARLLPLKAQVWRWIRSPEICEKQTAYIKGLYRRHASQEGNVLFAFTRLGFADDNLDAAVADLLRYQWPDGGWNCDKKRSAHCSTVIHTAIALRGLLHYQRYRPDEEVRRAIHRAAEFLLERRLFRRRRDGSDIFADIRKISWPYYHYYTHLFGLKVMYEGGFLHDERCAPALEQLKAQYLPGEGFRMEKKRYHNNPNNRYASTPVRWLGFTSRGANLFCTLDALAVLRAAARV